MRVFNRTRMTRMELIYTDYTEIYQRTSV